MPVMIHQRRGTRGGGVFRQTADSKRVKSFYETCRGLRTTPTVKKIKEASREAGVVWGDVYLACVRTRIYPTKLLSGFNRALGQALRVVEENRHRIPESIALAYGEKLNRYRRLVSELQKDGVIGVHRTLRNELESYQPNSGR